MWSYGQSDPTVFHIEMLQPNRSFWTFLTKSRIRQVYGHNRPEVFVDAMYDLAIQINAAPPRTPITVMWNSDLPHFDCTLDEQDERHHAEYSPWFISAEEYGSVTAWRTDSRPWVGFEDLIFFGVPGWAFFALTGEYGTGDGTNYACKHRMGKWFRQVIPAGSQIDLLQQEIRRFRMRHGLETEQISDYHALLHGVSFSPPCLFG